MTSSGASFLRTTDSAREYQVKLTDNYNFIIVAIYSYNFIIAANYNYNFIIVTVDLYILL